MGMWETKTVPESGRGWGSRAQSARETVHGLKNATWLMRPRNHTGHVMEMNGEGKWSTLIGTGGESGKKLVLVLPVSKCQYNQWSGKSWPCGTDMQSPAFRWLRQDTLHFKTSPDYTVRTCLRMTKNKKKDSALTINSLDANIVMSIVEIKKTGKERLFWMVVGV